MAGKSGPMWALASTVVVSACAASASDERPISTTSPTLPVTSPVSAAAPVDSVRLRNDPIVGRLVDWMLQHRDDVSIVISDGGRPPATVLNPETVRPIASTFKTIVLAAYARAVVAGRIDAEEIVPYDEIDRWLLEGTDGGTHAQMIEQFGRRKGVRVDDLAAAMMALSANTATDVLLDRLDRDAIAETIEALGLPALATAASPPAGAVALVSDPALGSTTDERLTTLLDMRAEEVNVAAWRRAVDFAADPATITTDTLAALSTLSKWDDQLRLAAALPWRAAAIDLHDLLVAMLIERRLGDPVAAIIASHMAWPLQDPALDTRFERMAAKEGATAGALVATVVARPRTGPAAGEDRVVVVGLQGMDAETWAAASEGPFQALVLRLLDDPAFERALGEALRR